MINILSLTKGDDTYQCELWERTAASVISRVANILNLRTEIYVFQVVFIHSFLGTLVIVGLQLVLIWSQLLWYIFYWRISTAQYLSFLLVAAWLDLFWLAVTSCHYLSRIDTDHYFCQFIMHGINVEKIIISPHVFKFQVGSHFSFSNKLLYAHILVTTGMITDSVLGLTEFITSLSRI